ncbi:MAG: GIY-YIG nuclease family protein [Spirochaetaceae bacterium]|jgi:hypothetical protein|nr:GIY-YIG nuclease family protein [Spirochaetaceae bacterium]
MNNETEGCVYVVSNPAMPDIVKIGITSRKDFKKRLKELYNTSVPFPFDCEYACRVADCAKVEKALQVAFTPQRINPQREFFEIEPEQAIAILKLLEIENITPEAAKDIKENSNITEIKSGENYKKQKRPPLNFTEMGIPLNATITFDNNGIEEKATVIADKKVQYKGEEYSLTKLTRKLMGIDYNVQPTRHWFYNGKSLSMYYNEAYGEG